MRCVSLFSGVGLLDLGAQRAGAEIVAQVEIEPYARRVLEARFPGVMRFDDVRAVSAAQLLAFGAVDLIVGGFPCQDVSSAGRRRGLDGERSGLWSEFARLIGATRPRWVLIENVARLRNDGLVAVAVGGVDVRPVLAWERGAPRSLSSAEAAERRLRGERRSNRLKAIGNGVVPQIVEWIVGRIVLADGLFGGTTR